MKKKIKKNEKTFENLDKSKCVPNSIVTVTPSLHNISSPGGTYGGL